MMRLLLVSSSVVHGTGYLDHCEDAIRRLFDGCRRVLFVPYAVHDRDGYAARTGDRFAAMGLELESVHRAGDPAAAVDAAEGLFIGGGNTFRLLAELYRRRLLEPIRRRVAAGMPYLGSSAGSNVAGATIRTTNDMPIVYPPSFDALALVPFQINPHYLDPDPDSTHQGESRDTRLREYLEENERPVVALREGAMLRLEDGRLTLLGETGGRLFRRGAGPLELPPEADLGELLRPTDDAG